jgi:hypothetical protein
MPSYTGSCHCGVVRFEIDATIDRVTRCNCSICAKKAMLHHRVQPEQFRLLANESDVTLYQFGSMTAKHYFCKHCGIHTHTRPRSAPELYTVNVHCLDNFDMGREQPAIFEFNGQDWEAEISRLP